MQNIHLEFGSLVLQHTRQVHVASVQHVLASTDGHVKCAACSVNAPRTINLVTIQSAQIGILSVRRIVGDELAVFVPHGHLIQHK